MHINKINIANRMVNGITSVIGTAIKTAVISAVITATVIVTISFTTYQLTGMRKAYGGWQDLFGQVQKGMGK